MSKQIDEAISKLLDLKPTVQEGEEESYNRLVAALKKMPGYIAAPIASYGETLYDIFYPQIKFDGKTPIYMYEVEKDGDAVLTLAFQTPVPSKAIQLAQAHAEKWL